MKFIILKEDLYIEEIRFLRGEYEIASTVEDEELVYEVEDRYRDKLRILEEAGLIKEMKRELGDIETIDDLYALTERVEIIKGGMAYMRVWIAGRDFTFTEGQLRTPFTLERYLLRLRKVIRIKKSDWLELLRYWLSIAEEIEEPSEEEEIAEKTLNYLSKCVIYKEKEKGLGHYTLYYDENEQDRVYCHVDELLVEVGEDVERRRLRAILSPYIATNSRRYKIRGSRYRFWGFDVEKSWIDLDKQLYERGEKEREEKMADGEEIEEGKEEKKDEAREETD